MTTQMDPTRAARLLERWFSFYGMDDPDAWPPEDYPQVKRAYEAMQLAVEVLRGNTPHKKTEIQKAIVQLEQWPTIHSMDDPDDWEPTNFPFVRNVLEAMRFTTVFLKEQQAMGNRTRERR